MRLTVKRRIMRVNAWVAVLLAAALVVMVNYVSSRHRLRIDLGQSKFYALTNQTRDLLDHAARDIRVVVFISIEHELYRDIRNLLREYAYASSRLQVEFVDPHRDLARSKELALKYDLTESDVVVFDAGDRRRIVPVKDIAEYDYAPMLSGRPKVMTAFRGEQLFSSAIQGLMQTKKPTVYFLAGHGEHAVDNFDRNTGYSIITRALNRNNIEVKSFSFGEANGLPADCDALVIAGPTRRLSRIEVEAVKNYLDNCGRLLLLLDAWVDGGLENLMETWGVRLVKDRVVGLTLTGQELLVNRYGEHPITANMKNITTIFNLPRSVEPLAVSNAATLAQTADKPRITVLASSTENGWAEMSANQNPPKFDPAVDRQGPIPVALAVEKGPLRGMDVGIKSTRIVIAGDSTMVSNGALLAGYPADFLINALNWLLERNASLAIVPREPQVFQVLMNRRQLRLVYLVVVGLLPAAAGLVGLLVWLKRRR